MAYHSRTTLKTLCLIGSSSYMLYATLCTEYSMKWMENKQEEQRMLDHLVFSLIMGAMLFQWASKQW